jgi:hypothetical protein
MTTAKHQPPSHQEIEEGLRRVNDYRKKHFVARVVRGDVKPYELDTRSLEITHNGFQYNTVSLTQSEMEQVISALQTAVDTWSTHDDSPPEKS